MESANCWLASRRRGAAKPHYTLHILPRLMGAVSATAIVTALIATSSASAVPKNDTGTTDAPSTFTIATAQNEYTTLDPISTEGATPQLEIEHLIAGTLTEFTPNAASVVPGLASRWTISPDRTSYTFTLRPGLHFSDGAPLLASDVAASYEREINAKADPNAGLVSDWKSISAPNGQTVVMQLKRPLTSLLSLLADPEVGMVLSASSFASPNTVAVHPISDGPYEITNFDPNTTTASLKINPYYFGAKPAVSQLKFVYVADDTTRLLQLESGQVDLAEDVTPSELTRLPSGITGIAEKSYGGWYLVMNDKSAPLNNVRVRKAISLAINREQLNDIVWGGTSAPLYGFFPAAFTWHENNLPVGVYASQARQELRGTPCARGCTINMIVRNSSDYYQEMGAIIQQDLSPVGIHIVLQLTDPSTANAAENGGKFQLDPEAFYDYANRPDVLLVQGLQSNGGVNALFSSYDSARMDTLIQESAEMTGPARNSVIHQINLLFAQDLPYAPLLNFTWENGETTAGEHWVTFEPSNYIDVGAAQ